MYKQQHALVTLFNLPAAGQLTKSLLSALLSAACEVQDMEAVAILASHCKTGCGLAGVAPNLMLGWLQEAVQLGNAAAVAALCASNGADALASEPVSALFFQAIDLQQTTVAAALMTYAAKRHAREQQQQQQQVEQHSTQQQAQQSQWLNVARLSAYFKAAIKNGCSSRIDVCRTPAVQDYMPEGAVLSLLHFAVENDVGGTSISALAWLPAARQLQPEQAVTLLQQALECGNLEAVKRICEHLPAASKLAAAGNAAQLLQLAAAKGVLVSCKAVGGCLLGVRRQLRSLPWPAIEQVLQQTLVESGAQSLAFKQLLKFLWDVALVLGKNGGQRCPGPSGDELKQWQAEVVARLAAAAVQVPDAEAVCMLCKTSAAKRIGESSGERLLQAVLAQVRRPQGQQQQQHKAQQQQEQLWQQQLVALCAVLALPAVKAKTADVVFDLLQQAVQQQLPKQLVQLVISKFQAVSLLNYGAAEDLLLFACKQGASDIAALLVREWGFKDLMCL
jgi:hypothetical protein